MHDLVITKFDSQYYVAIMEAQQLKHFYLEDHAHRSLVGNIYYGTVVRVLEGTQSAFVEIGQERTAFLHLKDCSGVHTETSISKILTQGQQLIVQVIKDPIGTKGARLSTEITLPSTYLVLQPYGLKNGISQKVAEPSERERLHSWLESVHAKGIIVRTVAQGVSEVDLEADRQYLMKIWEEIHRSVLKSQKQRILWSDLPLPLRVLRDFSKLGFEKIYVNAVEEGEVVRSFMQKFFPEKHFEIVLQSEKITAFSQLKIGTQFLNAMSKQVPLKSGGSVVIEQTESMVTIDVNTSGFVGKKNAHDTILKTNLEAVDTIYHQIPLRELGGLIIIDFIDMATEEDQHKVYQYLQEKFQNDLMPTHILPMSEVGLIQMTRKRITESSPQKYFQSCPCCHIRGSLLAPYVVLVKFIEMLEKISFTPGRSLGIGARQDVLTLIKAHEEKWRAYSGLESMPWRYDVIPGYHNQLTLTLFPS